MNDSPSEGRRYWSLYAYYAVPTLIWVVCSWLPLVAH